jgi:DnaD/phage-associated family protein
MSRRRYISTEISLDGAISDLYEQHGAFAVLLYTWMIPHTDDDATLHGTPKELIKRIMPERGVKAGQIEAALLAMQELGLITWDAENAVIYFPTASFYKYQTYVPAPKRRGEEQRQSAQNAEDNNSSLEPAQNSASPSPSPSLSLSPYEEEESARVIESEPTDETVNQLAFSVYGASGTAAQEIEDYVALTSREVVAEALRETIANARTARAPYFRKIMTQWIPQHPKTIADVERIRAAFHPKREMQQPRQRESAGAIFLRRLAEKGVPIDEPAASRQPA